MTIDINMPCWEIMQCENSENCPARTNPHKPCWEIALEVGDHMQALNICNDCIVYLLRSGESVFTEQELDAIIKKKIKCVLS